MTAVSAAERTCFKVPKEKQFHLFLPVDERKAGYSVVLAWLYHLSASALLSFG
jgi:hypothetical protein